MEQIINMKNVNGVYEAVDMNPFTEYVHPEPLDKEAVVKSQQQAQAQQQVFTKEQAMKNFGEFMSGIDMMVHVAEELMKRLQPLKRQ